MTSYIYNILDNFYHTMTESSRPHTELTQGLRVLLHYGTKDGHTIFYSTKDAEKLEKLYPAEMQFGEPSFEQLKELARLNHAGVKCIDEPKGK